MNAYTLEPQDLLFFRDGRPIATAGGHGARWPEPSVVFDAIHAALHRAFPEMQPWEHAHRFGRSSDRDLQRRRTQRFGSNRAAGSVWPHSDGAPRDPATLRTVLQSLGLTGWSVALVGLGAGRSAAELRETASDTIAGNPHRAVFGGINDREPSHTKFKVALLASQPDGARSHCLLAVAPNRQVRGHDGTGRTILCEAESLLLEVKPDPARWQQLGSWNHLLP